MSFIPISRIFRNVLWLIEQQENVAKEDCLGVWDLDKKTQMPSEINYTDLVQGLGFDYFVNSLYENIKGTINLSNIIDGELIFESSDVLKGEINNGSLSDNLSELIDFKVKSQIPKLVQTNVADLDEVKEAHTTASISEIGNGNWLTQASQITRDDVQKAKITQGDENILRDNLPPKMKRFALAHKLLLSLLGNELESYGVPKAVKQPLDLFDEPNLKPSFVHIPVNLWKEKKAVPHYDHNALNLGEADKAYVELKIPNLNPLTSNDRPNEHRFWITNIVIDEEPFLKWFTPQIAKYFKTPTEASMTFEKKHVIINFGEDKNVKVKIKEGFYAIQILMSQGQWLRSESVGITPETLHNMSKRLAKGISLFDSYSGLPELTEDDGETKVPSNSDDIKYKKEPDFDYQHSSVTTSKKNQSKKVEIQIAKSKLRREVVKYFNISASNQSKIDLQLKVIESANKSLGIVEPSYKKDPTLPALLLMVEGTNRIEVLDMFLPHNYEEDEANGNVERKKLQLASWNLMKDALKAIKYTCPHFYFHMRETGANSSKGAMRLNAGYNLIYKPDPEYPIKWTFN
jgi:hypothetical protein